MSGLTNAERAEARALARNQQAREAARESSLAQPLDQLPATDPQQPITRHTVKVNEVTGERSEVQDIGRKPGSPDEYVTASYHRPGAATQAPGDEWDRWKAAIEERDAIAAKQRARGVPGSEFN